jgi:hypothetical protein
MNVIIIRGFVIPAKAGIRRKAFVLRSPRQKGQ